MRVIDDVSTGFWENLSSHRSDIETIEGDIRDAGAMAKACENVEVVYHLAALGSVPRSIEDPVRTDSVNVGGTVTVLDAARRNGVRRVVFSASSSAYGDTPTLPKHEEMPTRPRSPYAVTKLTGEHYMQVFSQTYDLETISLRYFNIFGPHQRPDGAYAAAVPRFGWAAIRNETITVHGDGEQTRDFSFIDNAVQANLLAGSCEKKLSGQVVNIATGRRVSINNVIAEIGRLLGKTPAAQNVEPRAGDVRDSLADVTRARELLGYEPTVFWEDGVAKTLPYLDALSRSRAGK